MSEIISPIGPVFPPSPINNRKPKTPPIPGELDVEEKPTEIVPRKKEDHVGLVDIEA